MRTTLARQLRRYNTLEAVTDVIAKDFDMVKQNAAIPMVFTADYIVGYHRMLRTMREIARPAKEHRRSKSRRKK